MEDAAGDAVVEAFSRSIQIVQAYERLQFAMRQLVTVTVLLSDIVEVDAELGPEVIAACDSSRELMEHLASAGRVLDERIARLGSSAVPQEPERSLRLIPPLKPLQEGEGL